MVIQHTYQFVFFFPRCRGGHLWTCTYQRNSSNAVVEYATSYLSHITYGCFINSLKENCKRQTKALIWISFPLRGLKDTSVFRMVSLHKLVAKNTEDGWIILVKHKSILKTLWRLSGNSTEWHNLESHNCLKEGLYVRNYLQFFSIGKWLKDEKQKEGCLRVWCS